MVKSKKNKQNKKVYCMTTDGKLPSCKQLNIRKTDKNVFENKFDTTTTTAKSRKCVYTVSPKLLAPFIKKLTK